MKYKLINNKTKEETLCDLITIDGFNYYVNDSEIKQNEYLISIFNNKPQYLDKCTEVDKQETLINYNGKKIKWTSGKHCKKVIATNNPNIDIPKVINELEILVEETYPLLNVENTFNIDWTQRLGKREGFIKGYNKAKENYKYTEEDMLDFYDWCDISEEAGRFWRNNRVSPQMGGGHNKILNEKRKELFKIWKEQQLKTIYYE